MSYENQCGSCENSECSKESYIYDYTKYYCEWYKCYYYPDDSCAHYKKHYEETGGCYITTVMCSILGYTDECYVLTEMRYFRNNIMQRNPKYFDILLEYDMIGPEIANNIKKEYNETGNKDMWTRFYQLFLSETANLVARKEYGEAVCKYQQMMIALKNYFGISDVDLNSYREGYDMAKGGHGKIKQKKLAIC